MTPRLWANPTAPPVVIERLRVNGKEVALSGPLELPLGAGAVQISYDAPLLRVPERVRFRVQLDGVDSGWQEAGTQRAAHYTNLAPGHYVLAG